MMKIQSVRAKSSLGFCAIGSIFICIVLITYFHLKEMGHVTQRINELRVPTTYSSYELLNGINYSLASLRGWMLLGKEEYKINRKEAWGNIDTAIRNLNQFSNNWINQKNVESFNLIQEEIKVFKRHQLEIENIAHTPNNTPALKILFSEINPREKLISEKIINLIILENNLRFSSDRKDLIVDLANYRDTIGLALEALKDFLVKGDINYKIDFENYWKMSSNYFQNFQTKQDMLTEEQNLLFYKLANTKNEIFAFAIDITNTRLGEKWNIANYLLATKVSPSANQIKTHLKEIVNNQKLLLNADNKTLREMIQQLIINLVIMLAVGVSISLSLGYVLTRAITKPITNAISIAHKIGNGDLDSNTDIGGSIEGKNLGQTLGNMQEQLKQRSEILKQSELLSKRITETAVDAILTINSKGIVQSLNSSAEKMFGYQVNELIGINIKILMPNPYQDEHDSYLENYTKSGIKKIIGIGREAIGKRKDGSLFPIFISVGEGTQTNEGIIFTGFIRNISEQKKSEEKMDKYNSDLNKQNFVKSSVAKILNLIQGLQNIHHLAQIIISELSSTLKAGHGVVYLTEIDTSKEKHTKELVLSGSYAFVKREHLSSRYKFGEGLIGQCASEKKTISLSKVPEDYIKISSGLGEKSPTNLYIQPILYEGEVVAVIELASFFEFSKVEREIIYEMGHNLGVIIDSIKSRQFTEQLLIDSQSLSNELQIQKDELKKSNAELEHRTHSLKASEEELKKQSEELQATNDELAKQKHAVEQKNISVEEARQLLERKAQELEVSSKYKSEFLANMSHELRTPLNSMLLLTNILLRNKEGNLLEDQIKSLKVINSGTKDLENLINDILDLSKVEAGMMKVELYDVKLDDVRVNLEAQFSPMVNQKELSFTINVHDDCPQLIKTDGLRLGQILRNLLSNAIKFTDKGSVTLTIGIADKKTLYQNISLRGKEVISFTVTDTGIGIPEEKQQAIFEAFQQAEGSTTRIYGGTGLGLAISRELSKMLDGEMQLNSKENQGSTFTLYLPINTEGAQQELPQKPRAQSKPTTNTDTNVSNKPSPKEYNKKKAPNNDRTILIIESDPTFMKTLLDLSRERNYKCLTADSGSLGLILAREYQPTAIILDLSIPDIDGIQILEYLKFDLDTRHIPIYVTSNKDLGSNILQKGAVGILAKPANEDALQKVFSNIESILMNDTKKILIVEDDKNSLHAIRMLLDNKAINFDEAETGTKALTMITNNQYDCIILDLGLPDMTGHELLNKAKESTQSIPPVVVYTGRELSRKESQDLNEFTSSIIIKSADSPERLIDEISLFLHSAESSLPESQQEIIRTLHDPEQVLKGRTVLLADDDMRNVFALSSTLQSNGMNIIVAENGQESIDKIGQEKVDIALIDIMMPVMDGYTAIKEIRSREEYANLPIIALTAKAMSNDREKCLAAGANDYITKPIDIEQLLSTMRIRLFKKSS